MKYILLSYLALYWAIWLHTVVHSYMYKRYGCKKDLVIKVKVPLYLFNSSPLVDESEKILQLDKRKKFNISISGITVNIIFGIISSFAALFIPMTNIIYITLLYMFAIFNFILVAVSLIINNIFISGDIIDIVAYNSKYRFICFFVGIINILMITLLLIKIPQELFLQAIVWTCFVSMGMIIECFKNKAKTEKNK